VTPLISSGKVCYALPTILYVPFLDTRAGCLAPRPILQALHDPVNMEYSLVAYCVDMFITSAGHCWSLEVLLPARYIAALSTLIPYVASGSELIVSCAFRFLPTASCLAPSLSFPCSHLTRYLSLIYLSQWLPCQWDFWRTLCRRS